MLRRIIFDDLATNQRLLNLEPGQSIFEQFNNSMSRPQNLLSKRRVLVFYGFCSDKVFFIKTTHYSL